MTMPSLAAVAASPHLPALVGGVQGVADLRARSSSTTARRPLLAYPDSPSGRAGLIWLVVRVLAAYQRHYFANSDTSCAKASTIAATVLAGPLTMPGSIGRSRTARSRSRRDSPPG